MNKYGLKTNARQAVDRGSDALLAQNYERLKRVVIAAVGRHSNMRRADLEACYDDAWIALGKKLTSGGEIQNLGGFLIKVTRHRAIDELRQMRLYQRADMDLEMLGSECDFTVAMFNRAGLRSAMS
jgi:DNA-directed RNA polymerase specialized sigma24 family protein